MLCCVKKRTLEVQVDERMCQSFARSEVVCFIDRKTTYANAHDTQDKDGKGD